MTTTALPDTDPSAPRKGLDDPSSASDVSSIVTGTALADNGPQSTAIAASAVAGIGDVDPKNNGTRNGDRFRGYGGFPNFGNNGNRTKAGFNDKDQKGGLDPVAERALISVASIGEL
jgi:hypothetical protein